MGCGGSGRAAESISPRMGFRSRANPLFEANPGGAPCNVLAMLRKLGKRCAFVGKVGRDGFGRQLARVAEEAGIGLQGPAV